MKKKIIIMLIINLLILVTILGLIIISINKNQNNELDNTKQDIGSIEYEIKPVTDNVELFTVVNYIQAFLEQININNELYYTGDERLEQSFISEWTYSLLSEEYINKNSITEENVYEYVNKVEEKLIFVPLKMNVLELGNTTKYAIYGFCQTGSNEYREDLYFILNVDNNNNTYSIEPVQNADNIDKIELTNNNMSIEKNRYNSYKEKEISDEYLCEQYLFIYKRIMLSKPQEAYKYLNENYREKKFTSLQDFIDCVTKNKEKIAKMGLKAYSVKDNRYMCQDQWNNYYIFNLKDALDYDVMLDIYTVDLEEFTQRYNSTNEENKVAMNVEKIESAINNKDYKFVYDKLDQTFRNNNFQTIDDLEKYISANFYESNDLKYESVSNEGSIYVYKLKIIDANNENNTKDFTIIMKLMEEADFVMSFSM